MQHLEQQKHESRVDDDHQCDHERSSSAAIGDLAAIGFMNAHTNAIGQGMPPVAIPIQLIALIAEACGWPHFRASWPGNLPRLTTMITTTKMRIANTTKANASRIP